MAFSDGCDRATRYLLRIVCTIRLRLFRLVFSDGRYKYKGYTKFFIETPNCPAENNRFRKLRRGQSFYLQCESMPINRFSQEEKVFCAVVLLDPFVQL